MGDRSGPVLSWRVLERHGRAAQRDRSWRVRRVVRVELRTGDGRRMEAEAAPLPGHSAESVEDVERWLRAWGQSWPAPPTSGLPSLDFALSDLALQSGASAPTGEVQINALVDEGLRDPDLGRLQAQGIDTVKVKVGRPGQAEAEAAALAGLTGAGLRVRADANQGMGTDFDPEAWAALGLDLFEEPAPWPRARDWVSELPLAWDESVRSFEPAALYATPRPRAVVLKPTLLGAFERVAEWTHTARAAGLRVVFTHAYETEVGLRSLLGWTRRLAAEGERHGLMPHRFCDAEAFEVEGGILREAT